MTPFRNISKNKKIGFYKEPHTRGNFYEKVASKRMSKTDKTLESEYYSSEPSFTLFNLTLILSQGSATPVYDEGDDSDSSSLAESFTGKDKKPAESAEEGECNDDGVELKPSLRIKNLPSPERTGNRTESPSVEVMEQPVFPLVRQEIPKKTHVLLRRVTDSPPKLESNIKNEEGSGSPDVTLKLSDISDSEEEDKVKGRNVLEN